MTLNRLLLSICLLLTLGSKAQTTTAFRINYDQALMDLPGNAIEALTANNYIFAGSNVNFIPIYGTITEIDNSGALTWSKRYYDGSFGFQISDIKKDAAANEYYAVGGSESNAGVFMRIDAAGNVVVSKKFSISQADGAYFNRVIKVSDGGYVAVGYVTGHDPDGAGPEIDFAPITWTSSTNGNTSTDAIGSPLIVKFDASGNHVWHQVFRYYTSAAKTTAIYNDASLNDVIETTDGYIAVGSYDVNQFRSVTSGDDEDDATPTDAIVLKTTTAGVITYHKQYDAQSTSTSQTSKSLAAISKTSTGIPIAAGTDNSKEWIIKFAATGGWSSTFSRLWTYPGFLSVADVSQVYEVSGGTDLVTMATYISPLSFLFSVSTHRVSANAQTNVWGKYYSFGLAALLPRGSQTSDGGWIMMSTAMGASFDYHIIKTDPSGDTPISGGTPSNCPATAITPTASAGTTTTSDPYNNNWSGTVGSQLLTVTVANITPVSSIQCSKVITPCTTPTAPVIGTITQPTCAVATGSVALSGLPASGSWTVTASPGGSTITGTGTTATFSGLTAGTTYTFTVTVSSCVSAASSNAVINAAPTVPATPTLGTITQPTCSVSTGSVALSGLPSSGTWTVTASPGGATITGTGTTGTFSGLAPGTYTFSVSTAAGTSTLFSETFETGGPGWTFNVPTGAEGADPNFFTVSDAEGGVAPPGCGVALNGNKTLHITSVFNPTGGAAYDAGGLCGLLYCPLTNRRSESPAISSVGLSSLTLNFKYIANGQAGSDFATIWYNDGTGWYQLGAALSAPVCGGGQGQWSNYSAALPASCNNIANLKIAIKWQNNDDGVGTDPSVAINDITITAPSAGCPSLASASATINAAPTTPTAPVLGIVTQPTCSVATGSVALSGLPASGTWTVTASPGGATTTGTGTTGTFSGLTAGTYTFTVTNASGCTSVASSTSATINAAPTTPTAPVLGTVTQPTCSVATGSVALSGLPSSGTWTVTASPGGATTTGTGTTGTFSGLTAGTYTFTVTNASGCTSVASSTSATINAAPTTPTAPVLGTVTQPTCSVATGSVDLSGLPASGTWTVTASPGGATTTGTGTTGTFSGLTAGTYTFTVTNASGCTSVASSTSATITAAPGAPTAPVLGTVTQPTCSVTTGSVDLSGLPSSGTWTVTASPGGATTTGTGTTGTFSGLTAGTYTFTVTNASGCTSVASSTSATINAAPTTPTAPVLGTVTQPTCSVATGSVDLSGLPASGTWTVTASPGGATTTGTGTTGTFSGLTAGTYTFTVTNASGCTSVASSTNATITAAPGAPTAPVLGTVTQPTCSVATGSVALSGLPSSGTWTVTASPGGATTTGTGTTGTFSGLTAGTYTFTVTNASGCTSVASSTSATINAAPTTPTAPVLGTVTQPTCSVAIGSVDLSGLPASGTWTVTASPGGATTTGTGTTATFSGLTAGTYTFTVTNASGCTSVASSTSATITAAPGAPTAPVLGTVTQPTCSVATGSVDLSGLPSSGTWTVTASPGGATTTGTGTTGTFSGLTAGTYTFTVTNASGCTSVASSTSATINAAPTTPTAPVLGTVTQPTCSVTTGSVALSGLPSAGTWTVTASPGGATITGTGTTGTFSGLTAGAYTFTVTNASGCTSTASTSQTINSTPTPPSDPTASVTTQPTCADPFGVIDVTAPTGINYEYSVDGTNYQSGLSFTGLTPGSYDVTVQDITSGCISTGTVTLTVNSVAGAPVITVLTEVDVTCNGATDGSASVQVSGGLAPYTYSWSPTGGSIDVATGLGAGNYVVTVTDNTGCSSTQNITIGSPAAIAINGVASDINCGTSTGGSILTAATGGSGTYTYDWTPNGETTSSLANLSTGTYNVTVTDANGCSASDSYTINTSGSLSVLVSPTYSEINAGESVDLTVVGGTSWNWTPGTALSCLTCSTVTATPLTSTEYIVTAIDDFGCTGQDTAYIKVNINCGEFFVPNVFSPNDQGPAANNKLCVYGTPACIEELDFAIYNRWGEMVFQTTDITQCWDGLYKTKPMDSANFVYKLYVKMTDGTIIEQSGNTTLVR